ncbi:MAG: hypothetical protein ACYC3X_22045 [Pirellulaceae bacterium]
MTFLEQPNAAIAGHKEQDVLSLRLRWNDGQNKSTARVGMAYLQKGIRWVPGYKIDLDGQGRTQVKLQATLINEMLDLDNVTLNLVIGVPHFAFKETVDAISLGQTVAQLSTHFQEGSQTAYAFSNAIQTQVARMGEYRAPQPSAGGNEAGASQEFSDGNQREDLYVFTVPGVSLKKGTTSGGRPVRDRMMHGGRYKVAQVLVGTAQPLKRPKSRQGRRSLGPADTPFASCPSQDFMH